MNQERWWCVAVHGILITSRQIYSSFWTLNSPSAVWHRREGHRSDGGTFPGRVGGKWQRESVLSSMQTQQTAESSHLRKEREFVIGSDIWNWGKQKVSGLSKCLFQGVPLQLTKIILEYNQWENVDCDTEQLGQYHQPMPRPDGESHHQ